MRRAGRLLILGVALAVQGRGGVIVDYSFDGAGGFENPGDVANVPGLSHSPWSDSQGTGVTDVAGINGRAISDRSWTSPNAFVWALEAAPAHTVSLSAFSFSEQRSSTGPVDWALWVNGQPVAWGATSPSFATQTGALALSGLSGSVPFSLVASGASSSSGTWRIDDFRLEGEVVADLPEPGGLALLALGALPVAMRRRRRPEAGGIPAA